MHNNPNNNAWQKLAAGFGTNWQTMRNAVQKQMMAAALGQKSRDAKDNFNTRQQQQIDKSRRRMEKTGSGNFYDEVEDAAQLASVKLWEQGDVAMYSQEALDQRYALRHVPEVRQMLLEWWGEAASRTAPWLPTVSTGAHSGVGSQWAHSGLIVGSQWAVLRRLPVGSAAHRELCSQPTALAAPAWRLGRSAVLGACGAPLSRSAAPCAPHPGSVERLLKASGLEPHKLCEREYKIVFQKIYRLIP